MTSKTKKFLHFAGFFTSILLLMFIILFLVVFFTRNSGNKTMANLLQTELDSAFLSQYQIGQCENIKLPISVSAYAFSVNEEENKVGTIVAVRMTGAYGPYVGVFFYSVATKEVTFLDKIGFLENEKEFAWNSVSNAQIEYWSKNLSKIFQGDE